MHEHDYVTDCSRMAALRFCIRCQTSREGHKYTLHARDAFAAEPISAALSLVPSASDATSRAKFLVRQKPRALNPQQHAGEHDHYVEIDSRAFGAVCKSLARALRLLWKLKMDGDISCPNYPHLSPEAPAGKRERERC